MEIPAPAQDKGDHPATQNTKTLSGAHSELHSASKNKPSTSALKKNLSTVKNNLSTVKNNLSTVKNSKLQITNSVKTHSTKRNESHSAQNNQKTAGEGNAASLSRWKEFDTRRLNAVPRILDLQRDCQNAALTKDGKPVQFLSYLSTSEDFLFPYLGENGLHVQRGFGVRREIVDPVHETKLLCSPPLTDLMLLPNETTSRVSILGQQLQYNVGDTIQFRVDLFDSRGWIRPAGGDEIRMWLKSDRGDNSVPVQVLDLGNGSYYGVTELKWPGVTLVHVALTYPREFLRVLVELRHALHSLHWVTGIFQNKDISEDTICLPTPPIPGYATACNLTDGNGGSPWYCGHPTHPALGCGHWRLTGNLDFCPLPLEGSHRQMLSRIDRAPYKKLIPNDIVIITQTATKPLPPPLPPCWSRPRLESWSSPSPRGWVQGGAWRPTTCSLPDLTADHVRRCLADTGLLLVGDSNQGLFANELKLLVQRVQCDKPAQAVIVCPIPEINSTMIYAPHSKPFNVGTHSGKLLHTMSLPQAIQLLHHQNRTNNVVVVHYYVHNSFYSVHTYRLRVQYARKSIEEVLQKHPDVKIIIRGPHVIYQGKQHHAHFGDNFGPAYTAIWREEFRGLYDRVWFLDLWDLSIAMENMTSHPPHPIVLQMIKAMLGYFCEL
ncbi:hypothetical protein V1264_007012 [Littorina saxatilis]|uniref:NXPE C-terminal domain-containing protein n=2 Tax=Littorina saxatilis TaxID=31220 RepID=A0AAN9AVA7_9CAEN